MKYGLLLLNYKGNFWEQKKPCLLVDDEDNFYKEINAKKLKERKNSLEYKVENMTRILQGSSHIPKKMLVI